MIGNCLSWILIIVLVLLYILPLLLVAWATVVLAVKYGTIKCISTYMCFELLQQSLRPDHLIQVMVRLMKFEFIIPVTNWTNMQLISTLLLIWLGFRHSICLPCNGLGLFIFLMGIYINLMHSQRANFQLSTLVSVFQLRLQVFPVEITITDLLAVDFSKNVYFLFCVCVAVALYIKLRCSHPCMAVTVNLASYIIQSMVEINPIKSC